MKIGDIVQYHDKDWFLYDIYRNIHGNFLCQIVRIRNGTIYNEKNGEVRLNANIVNLPIENLNK